MLLHTITINAFEPTMIQTTIQAVMLVTMKEGRNRLEKVAGWVGIDVLSHDEMRIHLFKTGVIILTLDESDRTM